jgi:hypothetical protein
MHVNNELRRCWDPDWTHSHIVETSRSRLAGSIRHWMVSWHSNVNNLRYRSILMPHLGRPGPNAHAFSLRFSCSSSLIGQVNRWRPSRCHGPDNWIIIDDRPMRSIPYRDRPQSVKLLPMLARIGPSILGFGSYPIWIHDDRPSTILCLRRFLLEPSKSG